MWPYVGSVCVIWHCGNRHSTNYASNAVVLLEYSRSQSAQPMELKYTEGTLTDDPGSQRLCVICNMVTPWIRRIYSAQERGLTTRVLAKVHFWFKCIKTCYGTRYTSVVILREFIDLFIWYSEPGVYFVYNIKLFFFYWILYKKFRN